MAMTIRNEEHIKCEDGVAVVRAEIDVDTVEELPVPAVAGEKKLCQGSTALVIDSGLLVILNGNGEWVSCKGKKIVG
ncbi:MAG: hypothetical protein IKV85_10665 [Ruminococcus sp.]|nr:hypothetical protein [Ruminococcus sp.]